MLGDAEAQGPDGGAPCWEQDPRAEAGHVLADRELRVAPVSFEAGDQRPSGTAKGVSSLDAARRGSA